MHELEKIRVELEAARADFTKALHEYYNATNIDDKETFIAIGTLLSTKIKDLEVNEAAVLVGLGVKLEKLQTIAELF